MWVYSAALKFVFFLRMFLFFPPLSLDILISTRCAWRDSAHLLSLQTLTSPHQHLQPACDGMYVQHIATWQDKHTFIWALGGTAVLASRLAQHNCPEAVLYLPVCDYIDLTSSYERGPVGIHAESQHSQLTENNQR